MNMHYCYLYGGELDGMVFSHPSPGATFPVPGFSQPGSTPLTEVPPASYRLFQHWPGPTLDAPHWFVYIDVQTARPTPEALWRRVMPYILGARKLPDT